MEPAVVQFELDKTDDIMCLLPVLIICCTQCIPSILHVVSEQSISESLCQMSCSSSVLFPLSLSRHAAAEVVSETRARSARYTGRLSYQHLVLGCSSHRT